MQLSGRVIFGLYEAAKNAVKNCRICNGKGLVVGEFDCGACYELRYRINQIEKEFDKASSIVED